MNLKVIFFASLLNISYFQLNAQLNFEFYGAITLKEGIQTVLPYNLKLHEINGVLSGYSITDLGGVNETKNSVFGTYNKKTKKIEFHESEILYTKSTMTRDLFCMIHYSGSLKKLKSDEYLDGDFQGKFKDQSKCMDGTLNLISARLVEKMVKKADKKFKNSNKINAETKEKYNPKRIFDSLRTSSLTSNQNLTIFESTSSSSLEVWDNDIEDGDMINIYLNDSLIEKNLVISKAKKTINLNLADKNSTLKIVALNMGKSGLNTVSIRYIGSEVLFLNTRLKTGESASITILKNGS